MRMKMKKMIIAMLVLVMLLPNFAYGKGKNIDYSKCLTAGYFNGNYWRYLDRDEKILWLRAWLDSLTFNVNGFVVTTGTAESDDFKTAMFGAANKYVDTFQVIVSDSNKLIARVDKIFEDPDNRPIAIGNILTALIYEKSGGDFEMRLLSLREFSK
jgi:hypothetical protein